MIPSRFNIFEAAFLLRYFSEAFFVEVFVEVFVEAAFCGVRAGDTGFMMLKIEEI